MPRCWLGSLALAACALALTANPARADRLVLRNLTILQNKTVQGFDEDGVKLEGGMVVGWDEIERGSVAAGEQPKFDAMLKELGEPLYRIRQRLRTGDYEGLVASAEQVYPRYAGRPSRTAYLVEQALMWGRQAVGRREEAVEPYLYCFEFLRTAGGKADFLPGERRLKFDPATGLSPELAPIWFDAAAAAKAMPGVQKAYTVMKAPKLEAGLIYYATLALAAGDDARAATVLASIKSPDPTLTELRTVISASREVLAGRPQGTIDALAGRVDLLSPATRPLGLYWLGRAKIAKALPLKAAMPPMPMPATLPAGDRPAVEPGLLDILKIPASYGSDQPELAGAALHLAMETLAKVGDAKGSVALRKELLEHYSQSWHGLAVRATAIAAPKPEPADTPPAKKETP